MGGRLKWFMRSGMPLIPVDIYLYVLYADGRRVLESLKASKRLSEANFTLDIAPHGQRSVLAMFKR